MSLYRIILLLGVMLFVLSSEEVSAQMNNKAPSEFRGLDRWSFKTNAVAWIATIPNVSVEYDLSPSPYNRSTLGLSARYNGITHHSNLPYANFNLLSVRPEYRYYWRYPEGKNFENIEKRDKGAYYIGLYGDAGTYNMKFSEIGYQGQHYGCGLTMGFAMPLYNFLKGMLDIEFGFSFGLAFAESDAYALSEDMNMYDHHPDKSMGLHLIPYPVVSDISISFVWRRTSIKHKYIKINKTKALEREDRRNARKNK